MSFPESELYPKRSREEEQRLGGGKGWRAARMRKLILVNGAITIGGLLLDVYGVFDLSLIPAALGLVFGIIDCVTFVWMREDIKATFHRLRARQVVFQTWFEGMKRGEPQVVATITGRSVFNQAMYLAKKLGYEAADVLETPGKVSVKYRVKLRISSPGDQNETAIKSEKGKTPEASTQ